MNLTELLSNVVDAWNGRDAAGFSAAFTVDADYITADGERVSGRESIAQLLSDQPPEARASIRSVSARESDGVGTAVCQSTVVVGDVTFDILTTCAAVKQDGDWRITLLHNVEDKAGAGRAEPVLPAKNLDETRTFYRRLGFRPWFDGKVWPGYEIMSLGNLVVHFFDASEVTAPTSDAGCYLRVANADDFHQKCAGLGLSSEGTPRLEALCNQPWGMREFVFVDPSGNVIRVGQEIC